MPVTIKDIAKQAEVSHSTVSRALHGSPLITENTTERIRQTALELGYLPSAAARSLKTNRSQALGVIVSSVEDPFFSEILQGIEEVAQKSGYSLFMAASQRDPDREQAIVQAMSEHRVDGVIICSASFKAEQRRQFLAYGVPIVVVNNQSAEDYRYSIYHDDVDGSRQITRHLLDLGHRRIAYLGNSSSGRTTLDRLTGFQQEMDAAGLAVPPEHIHEVSGGGPEDGLAGLEHFLVLSDRPSALVCFNDMMAIGVLKGLQQAGIRVPNEFSVTGFDNIVFSAFTNPPLTTFDQPKRFIGAEAARLVLELLNTPPAEDSLEPRAPSPVPHLPSENRDYPAGTGTTPLEPGLPRPVSRPRTGTTTHPQVRMLKGRLLVRETTALPAASSPRAPSPVPRAPRRNRDYHAGTGTTTQEPGLPRRNRDYPAGTGTTSRKP